MDGNRSIERGVGKKLIDSLDMLSLLEVRKVQ